MLLVRTSLSRCATNSIWAFCKALDLAVAHPGVGGLSTNIVILIIIHYRSARKQQSLRRLLERSARRPSSAEKLETRHRRYRRFSQPQNPRPTTHRTPPRVHTSPVERPAGRPRNASDLGEVSQHVPLICHKITEDNRFPRCARCCCAQ